VCSVDIRVVLQQHQGTEIKIEDAASTTPPQGHLSFAYGPPGTPETVHIQPQSGDDSTYITLKHSCTLLINEELVRGLAPTFELTFTATAQSEAISNASAQSQRLQSPSHTVAVEPVEPAPLVVPLPVNLSTLLLGETQIAHEWPSEGLPLPNALTPFATTICITVATYSPPPSEAPEAPLQRATFLPPGLAEKLSPVIFNFERAVNLPDKPASVEQLDSGCYRCCLRFRVPTFDGWKMIAASCQSPWSEPATAHNSDQLLQTRTLYFSQKYVLFACDLDMPRFLEYCHVQGLQVEVHDRDAKPVKRIIPFPFEAPPPAPVEPPPEPVSKSSKSTAKVRLNFHICIAHARARDHQVGK
jgi:hypothetical protein